MLFRSRLKNGNFGITIRLLPAFILTAALVFVFRAGHLAGDVTRIITEVHAQENDMANKPAAESDVEKELSSVDGEQDTNKAPADQAQASPSAATVLSGVSRSEINLLQDLRDRREQLNEREQQAALREQLLASTERRIDKKISELRSIEENLSALVAQHEQRENAQIESIVKVYETMKPKDAAQIFEKLDTTIQQEVALRMSDRKMAALLAEMDPDAAQVLTTLLATRSQLPDVAALMSAETMP